MSDEQHSQSTIESGDSEPSGQFAKSVLPAEQSPEVIRKRYLAQAGQYYFRDRQNALAFEDQGKHLVTKTEDLVVVASMVELAKAKGWTSLNVNGSESFKRAVWLAAAERGITVNGYTPKPQDEMQLAEIRKTRTQFADPAIGLARARAFQELTREEAIKHFPELAKAYDGREAINNWIEGNIPGTKKQAELKLAVAKGMGERLAKGEIPSVVVLADTQSIDPQQAKAIRKQAIVMGAIARAKGQSPEQVNIVIDAAERIGRYLRRNGAWIPEPMVYDRNASARRTPTIQGDDPAKPEIRRQPRIQPRR